jgi:very-short-patch-repair endonuclease
MTRAGHGPASRHGRVGPASGPRSLRIEVLRGASGSISPVTNFVEGEKCRIQVVVRRTDSLPDADTAKVSGVPVTSVTRTLRDLATVLPASHFKHAFFEADRLGLLDDRALAECAAGKDRSRGSGGFRRLVEDRVPEAGRTRSVLEVLFLEICRKHSIRSPEPNVRIGGFEFDCIWREERLAVELDGFAFHRGREKFEDDATRANLLVANGWTLLRFTWRMVSHEPARVAAQVRHALEGARR